MASFSSGMIVSRALIAVSLATLWCVSPVSGAEPRHDFPAIEGVKFRMYWDPAFEGRGSKLVVSGAPIPLWMRALDRPSAELQRMTVDTISLAHRRGMPGLEPAVAKFVTLLADPDLDAELRRAVVAALIEFDAQDQIDTLVQVSSDHGATVAALVEPALRDWKSDAMVDQWLGRLGDASASPVSMVHAIDGLASLRHSDASDDLMKIVVDPGLATSVRMAAARAMGEIQDSGLSETAKRLVEESDSELTTVLLSLALLSRHSDAETVSVLQSVFETSENTAAQSAALDRLYSIDPKLARPYAADAIGSRDVGVRRLGAWTLIDEKTVATVGLLSPLLNDPSPALRGEVAVAMVGLAADEKLRQAVIDGAMLVLQKNDWRGCEQATLVLINLDHKPAGGRLVELLEHPRPEVMIVSGWGLRRLAIDEHFAAMLERAKAVYRGFKSGKYNEAMFGPAEQLAHLFTAFGGQRYRPAEELVRTYLPKDHTLGLHARPAAMWAIGLLHEGDPADDLVKLMLKGLHDTTSEFPETDPVRRMIAVSLVRMEAKSTLPDLREFAAVNGGMTGLACLWGIEQFTGEKPPTPTDVDVDYDDWFLVPAKE